MFLLAFTILASSFVLSLGLTALAKPLSRQLGLIDHPGERKVHEASTPTGGGLAIALTVFSCVSAGVFMAFLIQQGWRPAWLPDLIAEDYRLIVGKAKMLMLIFGGAAAMVVMGFLDDRRALSPGAKLLVQVAVALALVVGKVRLSIFITNEFARCALTVMWIVGITNAFNLLDNMDGLSAGVGAIVSAIFCVVAFQTGQYFVACLLLTLIGALGGFLVFNFHPASIFMGDTGALFLGYMMAVLTVVFTLPQAPHRLFSAVTPLVIMAVPLFDTISVVIIRIRRGVSPFQADKNHVSHRLVNLGMSTRQAVLTIYLLTAAVGLSATGLHKSDAIGSIVALVQALGVLMLLVLLEQTGKRNR